MKLFTLVTLLWNTNTIDVTGEWTLKYKTFGKKVEKELAIQVLQSGLLGRSSNSEFAMYMDDTRISWEMEVPGVRNLVNAEFKGELLNNKKMSGVVMLLEYPMNGRVVKWTAERKESGEIKDGKQ